MKICTRRIISFVAALTLLVTCLITGLVLPTAASEENLFTNGDMEQGASVAWGNASSIQSGVGKDGSYGYYHDRTQTDEWAATGQVRYKAALANKLEPKTEYILSFDYKTSGKAIGQLYFDVAFAASLNGGVDLPENVTNWTAQTFRFTTPDSISGNTGWEFSIRTRGGVGEVWYDNFKLIKAADAAPAKFEMADPGFDGAHGWTYNSTVTGQFAAGDAVPTQTDATGNKYITIPANGKSIRSPEVVYGLEKGDWIRIEFKARKNAAGKATVAMQLQGGMYDGYAQPEWTISASDTGVSGNGEWFTYVTYAQAQQATAKFYVVPFLLSNKTTADVTLDIDDVKLEVLPKGTDKYDFELLDGTGFANKPSALNDYGFGGLFNDGGKIVADPKDANNNVIYFDGTAAKVQAYFYPVNYTYVAEGTTSKKNVRMEANAIYKLTYRQKGTGTTSPGITPSYGSQLSVTGAPGQNEDDWNEWKDITVYYQTGSSVNANYMFNFIVTGEVYLDDFSLKLVEPATAIELDKTAAQVTAGQTLTLKATAKPEGAYATAITWSSSNEAIATVENGIVTGVAAGTATITATMGELTATCTVTVKAADAPIEPVEGLIYEYDFENGATGMFAGATSAGHFEVADGVGFGGGKALLIGYKTSDRWLKWPTTSFKANTRYAVTFLAKGPSVRFSIYKYAGSIKAKSGAFIIDTKPYADGWTSYRLEFTTGDAGLEAHAEHPGYGMYFKRLNAATEGEITYVDNFKIAEYSAEDERIIGGDFELPGMQQIYSHVNGTKGFAIVTDPDDANNKVLKIPAASAELGDNYMKGIFLEEGITYKLTFKAKGAPMSICGVSANITSEIVGWKHTEQSDDWKEYSFTLTGAAGARDDSQANWILNITRAMAADTDSYIDDLSIIATETPKAESIELNKTEGKLGLGATEKLTVSTTPAGAKYDSLTWASANTAVATVVDGVVTGVAAGETTITATVMVDGQPLTATYTVKVVVKATNFDIEQDEIHLAPVRGGSTKCYVNAQIHMTTTPADADVSGLTWTSSDESVATVENGIVKGVNAGTATITVTNGEVSDTVVVKVDSEGERISGGDFEGNAWNVTYWTHHIIKSGSCSLVADPTNADNTVLSIPGKTTSAKWMWPAHIDAGKNYKLTFKAMNVDGQAVMYFSTPSVVSGSGWLYKTIATEGWTEVSYIFTTNSLDNGTAEALNRNYTFGFGNQKSTTLYIDDVSLVELPAASAIDIADIDVPVKGTATLKVTTTPAEASAGTLTWTSSDSSIISVDANGKLTAVAGKGSVTITVTNGTLTATATATISGDPATAIALNKQELYLKKNASEELVVGTTPALATYDKFEWSSSNEAVVMVDQNGKVTSTGVAGTAVITVKSGELTATCTIIVMEEATSFTLADETVKLAPGIGSSLRVKKTLAIVTVPANANPGELTWASDNEAVATVDANGVVTALTEGTAKISVSKGGNVVDTCEVVVAWDGERLTGGDFENNGWNVYMWTGGIVKTGKGSVVTDPANTSNMVLALPKDNSTLSALWINSLHVRAGKTYKISFKVKGDGTEGQQLAAYFHGTSVSLNGWKYVSGLKADEWKEVSYIFTTNSLDDGTAAALNRNYCFGIDNNKDGVLYLDDFSLVELPEATAIVLPDEDVELWPTGSLTISANTVPAEASAGKLTWTSSDPNVVAIDANGKLTALADSGEVTITVTTEKGLTDTVKVVINEYANILENGDFEQGDTYWPSHATIKPGVGKDGTAGMLLDNTGSGKQDFFFKGKLPMDPGTTYIVEWDYLATPSAEFRLWGGDIGLALSASSGDGTTWKHGKKIFTTPTNMGDINSAAKKGWIFSVTSDVEGSSPAIVDNITIRLYNSGVKAESIKLTKSSMTMMPGRTANLGIMAEPADGDVNKSVWTSSNENVATVEYGIVTAIGKGTATITATTRDGVSATCEVTVSGNPAFITNGTFDDATDTTWGMTGSTAIVSESGTLKSNAASIAADGTLTYEIKGLQPETTYQFFIRYRSAAAGKLKMTLVSGEEDLLAGKTVDSGASWTKQTVEFITGETVSDTYTLTLSAESGAPILVDNVFLTQKATLIDFVVKSLVWTDSEQVKPGTELLFAITISNIGEDPVKAGSTIAIDICMDSKPVQTIEYTFNADFVSGDTEMIIGTEPWAAVKGDHVMSARVNSTLSVLESNVDNNNMVQSDLRVNDEILEVPEVAQQAGFTTLGFSDDFNTLDTVDMGATGADGYKWYVTRPYGATTLTTEDYSIENGILTMKNVIPTYNMGFSSADCKTGRGYQWNKGYLEYKLRIPRPRKNETGEDGVPAVWSLPLDKLMSVKGSDWVEMDWMEYWGIDKSRPGGYYTITLHDQGTDENDTQIWYNKNRNYSKEGLGDGEWHTMAFLWVQDLLIGYFDGEEVFRLAYSEDSFSEPMQSTIMADDRGGIGAFSYMNIQQLVLHLGGSKDNPMEMDYVRIWTGVDNGTFQPDLGGDDEEGGDVTIDIEAGDFWSNFCTDDYGDPIMSIDETNYLYITMGAEYWDLLSDERRAEINELLASFGQPTFEELMEEVAAFLEESPEAMAEVFLMSFFMDEEGNLITEVTTDTYLQILMSAEVFMTLDAEAQLAILELMDAYGLPAYDEMLIEALTIAEQEGLDIGDLPTVDDIVIPETGEGTTLPIAVSVVMLISAAGLWLSLKRRKA